MLVTCDVKRVSGCLDGDVKVGSAASYTPIGSGTHVALPARSTAASSGGGNPYVGKRQYSEISGVPAVVSAKQKHLKAKTQPGGDRDPVQHDGHRWAMNRNGEEFCLGYQCGQCHTVAIDGLHCGVDPVKVHQCEHCRKVGHAAHQRWLLLKGKGK